MPELHETVYDAKAKRSGEVMDTAWGTVQLRPLGGGTEWDADPQDLSPTVSPERLASDLSAVLEEADR
ncbi:hypothetical protein [Streptomyces aureocirculatus]|uniref:hypothetical protein n=1 Tax=Streptomyces aureocirculatus TaxID=67275 RepID=UPI0004C5CCBC|nr:hypothetical protein [Streptomyces aureocirculatus]